LLVLLVLSTAPAAQTQAPAHLSHGINITGWFRFPVSRRPADLAAYMTDQALADLHAAGFDFVRLAIEPSLAATTADRAVVVAAIRRIQRQGMTVVVSPHPHDWRLETQAADRQRLRDFWSALAPALASLDPSRTVPEILNEPVFLGDPAAWAALQHQLLRDIRAVLPRQTIVLTGQDWGSIKGLLALTPEDDPAVLYSFHFYDPAELTSLAAYRPGLDRRALTRLPFPVDNKAACAVTADTTLDTATGDLMRYYCALHWDAARIAAELDQAAGWARLHNVRLLAGEFGASADLNPSVRYAWLHTVTGALAARGIGWALWGYDDVMGLNLPRPPGPHPSLDRDVLAALGLSNGSPYAALKAGFQQVRPRGRDDP
jgi:endoglucanase